MSLSAIRLEQMRDRVNRGETRSLNWRLEQLKRLRALVMNHEQEVLEALKQDLGKPPTEAYFEVVALLQELKLTETNLRRWMRPRSVSVPLAQQPGQASVIPEPLGCVLIIGPWNYPFSLTLQPLISALAAGNTAVLKPSEHAPAVADLIERLIAVHLDEEVVSVQQGDGGVAAGLVAMPFDHIFFTGGGSRRLQGSGRGSAKPDAGDPGTGRKKSCTCPQWCGSRRHGQTPDLGEGSQCRSDLHRTGSSDG